MCPCKPRTRLITPLLLILFLLIGFVDAAAVDLDPLNQAQRSREKRLVISGGVFLVRFDSSYKYSKEGTTEHFFVDLEGQLDLPTSEVVGNVSAALRIGGNSYLGGYYTRLRRSSQRHLIDDSIDIGDDIAAIDAVTTAVLDYDFLDLTYGHVLHRDERALIIGKLGLHFLYAKAGFSIEGDLSVNEDDYSGKIGDEEKFVFAFPLLGAAFGFQLARRWVVENSIDFVYLPIGDTRGVALRTLMGLRYMISAKVGIQGGFSYNFERVVYEEDGATHEVEFDFSGLMLNAYLAF